MTGKMYTKAILAAIAVYSLWGFSFLASKVAQEHVTPFVLLAYRFDIAVIVLSVPLLLKKRAVRLRGKNILPLLALGLAEPCIYFIGEQYGLRYSNSSFSGVMIALIPIVTLLMSAAFLKDRPSRRQWLFSILSIIGVIVITLSEKSEGDVTLMGVLFLAVAVISGSAYGVLSRKASDDFSVFERSYVMQLMGAVFYTALALLENHADPGAMLRPLVQSDFVFAILYIALGASVAGYALFNYAVAHAPMANVVSFCNLTTVLSVLAGVIILGEPFSLTSAAAMLAVLIGIWGVQKFGPETQKNTKQGV